MSGRAVYFVGAGLPKSLQQDGFPIPLMCDFVPVAAHYAYSDDVLLTTLTQLEASGVFEHSTGHSIQLADSITPPKKASEAARHEFLQIVRARPQENIEALLIRADEMSRDVNYQSQPFQKKVLIETLPLRFSFAINRLFYLVGWNFVTKPLRDFLDRQFRSRDAATFISFNYDLMLEHIVEETSAGRWSARNGYGTLFDEFVEIEETSSHMDAFTDEADGGSAVGTLTPRKTCVHGEGGVKVLKPHGSLNWLCPFDGNYKFEGEPTHLSLTGDERVGYLPEVEVRLVERANSFPWPSLGVYISPPTKKTPLPAVLDQEITALLEADDLFVVGWSAPPTDTDQTDLIERTVGQRQASFRRVTVIDKNPSAEQIERLRTLFSPAVSFECWPNGFETYAIRND